MSSDTDAPVDLYVAAYADPDAARGDWDAIKQLATDDLIKVDGLILVSRRADGKIHVDDDFHKAGKGAAWGAVGGAIIGLIFPPTLLAGAVVGAGLGAGFGGLVSHGEKAVIKPGSTVQASVMTACGTAKWPLSWENAVTQHRIRRAREAT